MSTSARILQAALKSQQAWAQTAGKAGAFWAFPGFLAFGWVLFPALDHEWKQEMGWASDPKAVVKKVHAAKVARMEAHMKAKGIDPDSDKKAKKDEDEEEEEEEEEAPAEEDAEEEEETAPATEDEDAGDEEEGGDDEEEGGDDEGGDEEEDDDEPSPPKPLFDPVQGRNLTKQEFWDNFQLKSVRMNDEDDDEEDEDGE